MEDSNIFFVGVDPALVNVGIAVLRVDGAGNIVWDSGLACTLEESAKHILDICSRTENQIHTLCIEQPIIYRNTIPHIVVTQAGWFGEIIGIFRGIYIAKCGGDDGLKLITTPKSHIHRELGVKGRLEKEIRNSLVDIFSDVIPLKMRNNEHVLDAFACAMFAYKCSEGLASPMGNRLT